MPKPGYIKFRYKLNNLLIDPDQLAYELEYGNTFALYHEKEEIITLRLGDLSWIDWQSENSYLDLYVKDVYFSVENYFQKIFTGFLYNLQDFGDIYLIDIDHSGSSINYFSNLKNDEYSFQENKSNTFLGTVLKPYYHLTLKEKIDLILRFADFGFSYIKEDETYFPQQHLLIEETIRINNDVGENICYIPNITSFIDNYDLVEKLLDKKIDTFLVDIFIAGLQNIFKLKKNFPGLKLWGHRTGYKVHENVISVEAFSKLCLQSGISFVHIGTPSNFYEVNNKSKICSDLKDEFSRFIPVFTKTTPEVFRMINCQIRINKIMMACGYFRTSNGQIDWNKVEEWVEVNYCES